MSNARVTLVLSALALLFAGGFGIEKAAAAEIGIHAVVPLSPEYAFTIEKNSSLTVESDSVSAGDPVRIHMVLRAFGDEPLRGHAVAVVQRNLAGFVVGSASGETDRNGRVTVTLPTDPSMRERYAIGWEDRTYGRVIGVARAGEVRIRTRTESDTEASKRTPEKRTTTADNYAIIQTLSAWSPPGVNGMLELHESNAESQLEKGGPIADYGIGCASRGSVLSADTS